MATGIAGVLVTIEVCEDRGTPLRDIEERVSVVIWGDSARMGSLYL